jgi:hypothetical protein
MRRIRLISEQLTAVASGKLRCGRDQTNSDKQALTDDHLSRSIPLAEHSTHTQTRSLCPLRFVMAALGSTQFDRFAFPPSNPPFWNSHSIRSLSGGGSQKRCRPTAASSRPSQIEADRSTAARAKGMWESYTKSETVLICSI